MTLKSYDGHKFRSYERFFSALNNKTRFDIVFSLKDSPKSVKDLIRALGYEQSRVSHNLKILELRGFVKYRRKGKNLIYSLERDVERILEKFDGFMKSYESTLKKMKGGVKK